MGSNKFSKSEAIKFGWETTKKNLIFIIILELVGLAISVVVHYTVWPVRDVKVLAALAGALYWFIQAVLTLGLIKITLRFCDNQKSKVSDLFSLWKLTIIYLVSSLIYFFLVSVGLALLVVPGIILAIRGQFFGYLMVDKQLGPLAAVRESLKITKGSAWNLFLFGLLVLGINILGLIVLGVGVFLTIPLTAIAMAWVFRKLLA